MSSTGSVSIVNDMERAIALMQEAGKWLVASGKNPTKWWQPQNLNQEFLLRYLRPDEFYVVFVRGVPAAAAGLQIAPSSQGEWKTVDGDNTMSALYIHWLCVSRAFAGKAMPQMLIDFAETVARKQKIGLLRVDTNAEEAKLRNIYERMGFTLVAEQDEAYRKSAYYQKHI